MAVPKIPNSWVFLVSLSSCHAVCRQSSHRLDVVPALHVGDVAVSICWLLRDSCNHHAKCIIHKLFSVTFCTVALIIIITEAQ